MYSKKQRENISKNLKFLRKYNKEKQFEVAESVNMNESTYSEYVSMKREPTKENIIKLAKHYGLTEVQLTDSLIPEELLNSKNISYEDTFELTKKLEIIYPIIKINNIEDKYYDEASKLHKEYLSNFYNTNIDTAKIIEKYYKSYDEYNNLDSYANIVLLFLISKIGLINRNINDYFEVYNPSSKHNYLFLFKEIFLKRFDDDDLGEDERDDSLIDKIDILIDQIIDKLKENKKYYHFLEYFLALNYYLGIGDKDYDTETNRFIGTKMLKNLYILDNEYAVNFTNKLIKILNFDSVEE